MYSTATAAQPIPADLSSEALRRQLMMAKDMGKFQELTIPTDEPFIPLGSNLDGEKSRHHRMGRIVIKREVATGRLFVNDDEIIRLSVNELIPQTSTGVRTGWTILAMLERRHKELPANVCILNGLFTFTEFLPAAWKTEKEETFFLGTIYEVKRLGSVHEPPGYHALALSKRSGVIHWETRFLDFDFSNRYVAVVVPRFDLKGAA